MPDTNTAVAKAVVASLGARLITIRQIVGLGEVNHVFVVETDHGKWVVRFHIDPLETDDYEKEEWCLKSAALAGIPVPQFIARGQCEGTNFIVQSFVEGEHGDHCRSTSLWKQLGAYAKTISEISLDSAPASLFPRFGRDPVTNWRQHVTYNIEELKPDDPLLALGAYDLQDQLQIKEVFRRLEGEITTFGLSHGDVVPKNVIVPSNGAPVLIDWGSASVYASPFDAILRIQMDEAKENFCQEDVEAFASGFGVELLPLQPTLQSLWLLNRIDLVRWAIGHRPDRLQEIVGRALAAVVATLSLPRRESGAGEPIS